MKSNNIIIFCQAPADIPYVLKLYEQNKEHNQISIFVINVEGMFLFLSNLNLDVAKLIYIPYKLINVRQLSLLNAERKRINQLWQIYFSEVKDGKVYFFSRFEDWLTGAFISRFAKNKEIQTFYLDHYDNQAKLFPEQKYIKFKTRIYLLILKFLTGVNFHAKIKEKIPEFPIYKHSIVKQKAKISSDIFVKYSYRLITENKQTPNLLFFISPCEITIFNPAHYDNMMIELILLLKNIGFNVIVKGHPRTGIPQKVSEIADSEIPTNIPAEFIDIQNFRMCVGLDTTALCYFAKKRILPTYSLINIFPTANDSIRKILVNYLYQQSNNEMLFIDNKEKLKEIALTYV